jgi:hypothetical protein
MELNLSYLLKGATVIDLKVKLLVEIQKIKVASK